MTAVVYTDGACDKQGLGGWAWCSRGGKEEFGAERETTNNRMELFATIHALRAVPAELELLIVTDSAYVSNCFLDRWHEKWRRTNWINAKGKPVENRDLWEELLALVEARGDSLSWLHVRGHGRRATDDPGHVRGNARADLLAVEARKALARAIERGDQ